MGTLETTIKNTILANVSNNIDDQDVLTTLEWLALDSIATTTLATNPFPNFNEYMATEELVPDT